MAVKKTHHETATELALAVGGVLRRMRAVTVAGARELSLAHIAVMKRLLADGPATTAELARGENVRPQSMGATIAEMEEQGMVRRRAHPTDGRQMLVELTSRGEEIFNEGRAARRSWLADAIAQLSAEEQRELAALTPLLKRLAEL